MPPGSMNTYINLKKSFEPLSQLVTGLRGLKKDTKTPTVSIMTWLNIEERPQNSTAFLLDTRELTGTL